MKRRVTLSITFSVLVPALFLVIISQGMAQAAGSRVLLEADISETKSSEASAREAAESSVGPDKRLHTARVAAEEPAAEPDLGISKSASANSVTAGEKLTYTLLISNSGLVSATNVVVTDTLPPSLTVDNVSTSLGDVCLLGAELICSLDTMLVNTTETITVATTTHSDASGLLHNFVQVGSAVTETNSANNSDAANTTVLTSADLSITKSSDRDSLYAGEHVTYTLIVINGGPSDAASVVVTDTVPASTTVATVTPSQGDPCSVGSEIECSLGALVAGEAATVTLELSVDPAYSGLLQNKSGVSSATADPVTDNNTASESTTVDPIVDLIINKSSDPAVAIAGADLTYQLLITNAGYFSASNVMVTDTLPGATSVITATAGLGGECSLGEVVTCTLGTVGALSSVPVTIEVTVDSSASGALENRAEVAADTADRDEENNEKVLVTTIESTVDLSIGKSADPDPAVAGGLLSYNIVINNEGPSDAAGVTVSDTLPLSTTYVSASVVQGATVIHTIDTSIWDPSSPDPAALAYIPASDQLMVGDSEVDEFPFRRDENLFHSTRSGDLITVTTTTRFSDEPSGMAYDPGSATLFVADDTVELIFLMKAGPDNIFGTPDDPPESSIDTAAFLNFGPEGLAFDTDRGHLLSVDGGSNMLFDISPGADGIFNGVPPTGDDVVTSFSVSDLGIQDPEGLTYNPQSGTIFVGDHRNPRVIETTVNGILLRTFDLTPDTIEVSGLTIGPSTANPSVLSLYVSDRGVDNNADPTENDGMIYEVNIPSSTSPGGFCTAGAAVECELGVMSAGDQAVVTIIVEVDVLASGVLTNAAAVSTTTPDSDSSNDDVEIETPVSYRARLKLFKDDDPDPVTAGERLTYTLTISNPGPSHAQNVTLEDNLPAGVTISSTQASQGAGCTGVGPVTCELGEVLAGTQATVTLVVDVASSAQFSLTNMAEVDSTTPDGFHPDNLASEVTTVTTKADLAIVKSSWPLTVTAGEQLTYTLAVSNSGPSDAQSVMVTDTLPIGVQLASAIASQGSCGGGSEPVCDLGTIAAKSQASITMVVTVTSGVTSSLTNTATVASATNDPFPDNNEDQIGTAILTQASMSLVKEAHPEPVLAGAGLIYTLTVANAGPSDALGVVVTDSLPAGVAFVSGDSDQGALCSDNGQVWCELGTLAASQEAIVVITTTLDPALPALPVTNTAGVISPTYDPDMSDNTDSIMSTVQTKAGLSLTKTASEDTVTAGEKLTYTLTISNPGPSHAQNVTLEDNLPAGTTISFTHASQGLGCSGAGPVTCELGQVLAGAQATVTLVVDVSSSAQALLTNTAEVTSSTPDDFLLDNFATEVTTVTTKADLAVVKSSWPLTVTAGERLTYTLALTNSGPSDAQSVVVTDTLPAGVQLASAVASQGSCGGGSEPVCDLGTIAAKSQASITMVVTVTSGVTGSLTNSATVASTTADPLPDNNESHIDTAVLTVAGLSLVKEAMPEPVTAGEGLTYTVTVSNAGPSVALGVVVTDILPAGVNFISGGSDQGALCSDNGQVSCDLGSLAPFQEVIVTITTTLDPALPALPVSNTAGVSSTTHDPDMSDNTDTISSTVVTEASLAISKAGDSELINAGEGLTYTLTISNAGPSDAQGVVVTDSLPAGVNFISGGSDQGALCSDNGQVSCELGTLAPLQQVIVTITTLVDPSLPAQTVTNTAWVSSTTYEQDKSDNAAAASTTVQTAADLSIEKIASDDPVTAGESLTYTLTVRNLGPSDALSVTVTDTLPSGVTLVSVTPSLGEPCQISGSITCDLGDLPPLATETILIEVTVNSNVSGAIENSAGVTSLTYDGDVGNNTAKLPTTVETGADMSIEKNSFPPVVVAGEPLTYTLVVANSGPSDALGVVVTDTLPAGIILLNIDSSKGSCGSGPAPVCDLGVMASNSMVTITVNVHVPPAISATLHNEAEVSASTSDPLTDNNMDQIDTAVLTIADLSLQKEAPEQVSAGSLLTYKLTINNDGPSDAVSVVVTDSLPAGANLLSVESSQGAPCTTAGQIACHLGAIGASQDALVTITTRLDSSLPASTILNKAGASSPTSDPDSFNNAASATTTVVTEADLVIDKLSDPNPVTAGETLTYTLTVQNLGPSNASTIFVTDTLPAEVAFVSVVSSQGPDCSEGATVVCEIGDLAYLASATITIVVTVDSDAPGTIDNTARVKGDQHDPDTENNIKTWLTSVNREGSLPFSKVDDPDPVVAGTNLTYTLSVTSSGPSDAENVLLIDTLSAGVQFVSVAQDLGICSESLGVVTCDLGSMPVGVDATVVITVDVLPETLGQINNNAIVSADATTPSEVNQSTTVVDWADLSISSAAGPDPVLPGGMITFTLSVTNGGPSLARNVTVNNTLPAGVTFNNSPDCAPDNGVISCAFGQMDLNESIQTYIVVDVNPDTEGLVSSVATVFGSGFDPRPGNNSSSAGTHVVPESDLMLVKQASPGEIVSGDTFTYTLTITNDGPSPATGVEVIDALPEEVTKVSTDLSQGSGCLGTSTIICRLGDLGVGATATITIVVTVDSDFAGQLENTASVFGSEFDPDESNNATMLLTTVAEKVYWLYLPAILR